jgi:phosphatidylglycerophosphate synthase
LFAAIGAAALLCVRPSAVTRSVVLLLCTPAFMWLRGLCNLLDGLVAIEGGARSRSGELFNDMPDRFSDLFLYGSAGYAVFGVSYGVELGWVSAAFAIISAYVRYLGAAMGAPQFFVGPLAKMQRMTVLSIGCVAAALELWQRGTTVSLLVALGIIAGGGLVTVFRRARLIYRSLEKPQ